MFNSSCSKVQAAGLRSPTGCLPVNVGAGTIGHHSLGGKLICIPQLSGMSGLQVPPGFVQSPKYTAVGVQIKAWVSQVPQVLACQVGQVTGIDLSHVHTAGCPSFGHWHRQRIVSLLVSAQIHIHIKEAAGLHLVSPVAQGCPGCQP